MEMNEAIGEEIVETNFVEVMNKQTCNALVYV